MILEDFDFELPSKAIALRPVSPRDSARMLSVDPAGAKPLSESIVRDLPRFLSSGDVMVFNDTKVIPAEIRGFRAPRAASGPTVPIALTLVERLQDGCWRALARPAKRLQLQDEIFVDDIQGPVMTVALKHEDGHVVVRGAGSKTVDELIRTHGAMPLPPYISKARRPDCADFSDYQTIYAETEGAVAAPTAGLHFTETLLKAIEQAGVKLVFCTLHVGPGTFLPVKDDQIEDHTIHEEWCELTPAAAAAINEAKRRGGRLVATGTTSLRLLEAAARDDGEVEPLRGTTKLFIKPGYRFRAVDMLFTNFHLPKSTLFMLVCAFSGMELMKEAYAYAIASGFRFYSYGDACLLRRAA